MSSATYTVTATHSDGSVETFSFNLRSLADYDGDGLPNDLPSDYNAADQPTPGLVADDDDDADGLLDSVETDTGTYIDASDTGTDPLNPDTDGDGICDGPNAVAGVCVAGPDMDPNGESFPPTLVALNNTAILIEIEIQWGDRKYTDIKQGLEGSNPPFVFFSIHKVANYFDHWLNQFNHSLTFESLHMKLEPDILIYPKNWS